MGRLISLNGAVKSFGARTVLDGLDLEVDEGARIGVVGQNGSGKSTLLRILAGLDDPDNGAPARRRGLTAAYLPQLVGAEERTPVELCRAARPAVARVEAELERCAASLADPTMASDLRRMQRTLDRQQQLLDEFERLGGHAFEGTLRSLLADLGVSDAEAERPQHELSGGKRKLVAVAACLVAEPDLLLLDEPETHLDAYRRSRIEELVRAYPGAVLMVSHDRYLLDETVSAIAEVDRGTVRMWPGNYSAYHAARELELHQQQAAWAAQQKEIERLEDAIRRYKQWASMVDDRRHTIRARNTARRIDRMDKVERPVLERRRIGLRLRSGARGGKRVAEWRGVSVAFGGDPVLVGVDLTVFRGERVGVIGDNGSGKSVLVRLLAGGQAASEGEMWVGPSIEVGFLPQEHARAPAGQTPIDAVRAQRPCSGEEAVSALLRFLFTYEQCRQQVNALSGGERTRLELLLLMRSGANCLVLDEPTNHLDIDSVEMLESAIEGYDGTVVFVSHDRYFLDRIADRIVEVRDGDARASEGGYSTWYARRRAAA